MRFKAESFIGIALTGGGDRVKKEIRRCKRVEYVYDDQDRLMGERRYDTASRDSFDATQKPDGITAYEYEERGGKTTRYRLKHGEHGEIRRELDASDYQPFETDKALRIIDDRLMRGTQIK